MEEDDEETLALEEDHGSLENEGFDIIHRLQQVNKDLMLAELSYLFLFDDDDETTPDEMTD